MRIRVNTHLPIDARFIFRYYGGMKKKRLNVTLSPDVWDQLRTAMFLKEKPANYLIEQSLKKTLPKKVKEAEVSR